MIRTRHNTTIFSSLPGVRTSDYHFGHMHLLRSLHSGLDLLPGYTCYHAVKQTPIVLIENFLMNTWLVKKTNHVLYLIFSNVRWRAWVHPCRNQPRFISIYMINTSCFPTEEALTACNNPDDLVWQAPKKIACFLARPYNIKSNTVDVKVQSSKFKVQNGLFNQKSSLGVQTTNQQEKTT